VSIKAVWSQDRLASHLSAYCFFDLYQKIMIFFDDCVQLCIFFFFIFWHKILDYNLDLVLIYDGGMSMQ
jgi:hypothetical protein